MAKTPTPPSPLTTRFAPSPTGYLHLGHVASAIYVFGLGRRLGAKILLRIEDHDRQRSRAEYERAIFDDLTWLGLRPDNPELGPGVRSRYRQSDNEISYDAALAELEESHHVYACDCSRKQIAESSDPGELREELRYTGRCRDKKLPLDTPDTGLRIALPDTSVTFDDIILGPLTQTPATQCGDLLLRDRHGQWTYQFAVAVDDRDQEINLVIRGQDLTGSTARQILLGRWLHRDGDARFAHHALITDKTGQKLGKRFFSEAIAKRRAARETREAILGDAAFAVGLTDTPRPLAPDELPSLFDTLAWTVEDTPRG